MSDFDRFFAEKLDEEGDFPRRDRNWKQLSQRLDAFDAGGLSKPSSRWLYWPAAAAIVVSLTVAGWLLFKMQTLQQENTVLRQEIADLRKTAPPVVPPAATIPGEKSTGTVLPKENRNVADPSSAAPGETPKMTNEIKQVAQQPPEKMTSGSVKERWLVNKQLIKNTPLKSTTTLKTTPPIAVVKKPNPTPAPGSDTYQPPTSTAAIAADSLRQQPVLSENVVAAVLPVDSSNQLLLAPSPDSMPAVVAEKEPDIVLSPSVSPDTVATAAVSVPPVKPFRPKDRFRLGVEMVSGLPVPRPAGVSLITGSGITASYSPLRDFRVFAAADWVHFEVNTDRYVPQFHKPREQPPMHPPGPYDQLVQVESSQRQQHYALGIAYAPTTDRLVTPGCSTGAYLGTCKSLPG